ncbi:centrosomal protein of 72 kDa [Aplochiton taeniatus]
MAAECLTTISEQWIRERLQLSHHCLADVRSLILPGTYKEKIKHLGISLKNFVRLKTLDLSCNALVSIEGVHYLKMLERLNLYYNCIPSIEEIRVLSKLTTLKELDLRLNPLTRNDPQYRLYLVHALLNLRKLDDCPVRDTERKAAIMHFSSDATLLSQQKQKSSSMSNLADQKSGEQRLAKRHSFMDDSDDIVLNFVAKNNWGKSESQQLSGFFHKELESQLYRQDNTGGDSSDSKSERSSIQKQGTAKSILRSPQSKEGRHSQSGVSRMTEEPHRKRLSMKGAEGHKVTFDPHVEKHRPGCGQERQQKFSKPLTVPAKGHFTPNPRDQRSCPLTKIRPPSPRSPGVKPSDVSNPVLHPPRLSYSSFNKTAGGSTLPQKPARRGRYRKPLEMLLNLVDKHWAGERSLHHNNNFLSHAVQILSMMEQDISSREAEVRTLREEVEELKHQVQIREQEHKTETQTLLMQLKDSDSAVDKVNEQLRIVLAENVSLQKQLIKLEQQYLNAMMKSPSITDIKKKQTEVDELRKEVATLREKVQEAERVRELADMLQESHRSLVATNERLLGELDGARGHC